SLLGGGGPGTARGGPAGGAGPGPARAGGRPNPGGATPTGRPGPAGAHPADLMGALQARAVLATEAKVVALETALERIQRWRAAGERVAFTNGCFDLIHPGHISLLSQARAAADRLVVGLNSDASVQRLKGPSRPVQNET